MSIAVSTRVWASSKTTVASHRLMLLAIADFANDKGEAWPSIGTLAARCCVQERRAVRIIGELCESGELQRTIGAGPRGANIYRVLVGGGTPPGAQATPGVQATLGACATPGAGAIPPVSQDGGDAQATPAPEAGGDGVQVQPPLAHTPPEPSLNRQEPSAGAALVTGIESDKRAKSKPRLLGLKAWLEAEKAAGRKAVPEDDPVFGYAGAICLPPEFLTLAWQTFRTTYTEDRDKRYTDWRKVFRNAVKGNWLKLWYLDKASGEYRLTTVGEQASREQETRAAA